MLGLMSGSCTSVKALVAPIWMPAAKPFCKTWAELFVIENTKIHTRIYGEVEGILID
jgi:hypothetical protein